MKDFFIEDAVRFENTTVTSYFVLSSMQVRDKKQGGQYLALIVSDRTGSLEARMWDDVADPIAFLLNFKNASNVVQNIVNEALFFASSQFTVDQAFGGWAKAQKTHFADGGVFDKIYAR